MLPNIKETQVNLSILGLIVQQLLIAPQFCHYHLLGSLWKKTGLLRNAGVHKPGWVRRWVTLSFLVNQSFKEKDVLDFTNVKTLYYFSPNFFEFLYYWIPIFRQSCSVKKQIRKEPHKLGAIFPTWGNRFSKSFAQSLKDVPIPYNQISFI